MRGQSQFSYRIRKATNGENLTNVLKGPFAIVLAMSVFSGYISSTDGIAEVLPVYATVFSKQEILKKLWGVFIVVFVILI